MKTLEERFWAKVDKRGPDDCWNWTASVVDNRGGGRYGKFKVAGKTIRAARLAYELEVGPIPDGLTIDHLCRNTLCVNPAHLEPVTQAENNYRGNGFSGRNRRKTHCKHGHEFTEENTYYEKTGRGHLSRKCKACMRRRTQERLEAFRRAPKQSKPLKEVLEKEIQEQSWCALGRKYGVSDSAVRKWAKGYGLL